MQFLFCRPSILMIQMPTQPEIGFHAESEHNLMSVVLRAARGGREEPGDPEQHDRRARPQAGDRQGALPTAAVPYLQGGCWSRREAPLPSVLTPPARALFAAHSQCPCGFSFVCGHAGASAMLETVFCGPSTSASTAAVQWLICDGCHGSLQRDLVRTQGWSFAACPEPVVLSACSRSTSPRDTALACRVLGCRPPTSITTRPTAALLCPSSAAPLQRPTASPSRRCRRCCSWTLSRPAHTISHPGHLFTKAPAEPC